MYTNGIFKKYFLPPCTTRDGVEDLVVGIIACGLWITHFDLAHTCLLGTPDIEWPPSIPSPPTLTSCLLVGTYLFGK